MGATGGCIGMLQASPASHLESHGSVTLSGINNSSYRGLGGVVGYTMLRYKTYSKLTDCYNAALLTSNSNYGYVGGVVGAMITCDAERCYNAGPYQLCGKLRIVGHLFWLHGRFRRLYVWRHHHRLLQCRYGDQ